MNSHKFDQIQINLKKSNIFTWAFYSDNRNVDQTGIIFHKYIQICAYSDDIRIMASTETKIIVSEELEKKVKTMGPTGTYNSHNNHIIS